MTRSRIRETGRSRTKKGVPRGTLVVGLVALLFLVLVAVFVAGRWPQGTDGENIAVSREKATSFPIGKSEFDTSESLYVYLRHDGDSELRVRHGGRASLLSVILGDGEKLRLVKEGGAREGPRFRLETVSGGKLPPGSYSVILQDSSGEIAGRETFSVRRW